VGKGLPGDYEKQEKFFMYARGSPGFSNWREIISTIWNREKVAVYMDFLDAVEERLGNELKNDKEAGSLVAKVKGYLKEAMDIYNRQFVLYYILEVELGRLQGDMPLLRGVPVDILKKARGKGMTLESDYYSAGNRYLSSVFAEMKKFSESGHKLAKVLEPLSQEDLHKAVGIRMSGRGEKVSGKKRPNPGTASS